MTAKDEQLSRDLRALAELGARGAPASVEAALVFTFRRRKARRRTLTRWAIAVAAGLLLVAFLTPRPQQVAPPQPRMAHITPPVLSPASGSARSSVARHHQRTRRPSAEVATRFYPLPDAAALAPFEYGTLVRVQLPRSALRVVGLPVNEDRLSERINADVLLGQDGLARAVRFVQ